MNYYYLDGLDKKGPYSAQEILNRQLSNETLVYSDNMSNWTLLKDVPELQPLNVESLVSVAKNDEETSVIKTVEQRSKVTIPAIAFLFLGIFIAIGLGYLIVNLQVKTDLNELTTEIDNLMLGKDEICDYQKNAVRVKLLRVPDFAIPTDNEGKKVKEAYELLSGGFQILTLTKTLAGYDILATQSKNMAFKVSENHRIGGEFGITVPTYRGTVQGTYNIALEYLTSDKENKSYSAGTYDKIKNFQELSSSFHKIENIAPSKMLSGSVNSKSWTGRDGSVFNSNYILWYDNFGEHYEVTLDQSHVYKVWLIYSCIGSLIALIVYLILRYRKRVDLKIT